MTMTQAIIAALSLAIGLVVFFTWARWHTRRVHARYTRKDMRAALERVLGEAYKSRLDDWQLFLAWPIDDEYLESVRRRCLSVEEEHGGNDDEWEPRLAAILDEIKADGGR